MADEVVVKIVLLRCFISATTNNNINIMSSEEIGMFMLKYSNKLTTYYLSTVFNRLNWKKVKQT